MLEHRDSTSPFTPETSRTEEAGKLPLYWGRKFLCGFGGVKVGEEREGSGCLVLSVFVLPPFPIFLLQCIFLLLVIEMKMINAQI